MLGQVLAWFESPISTKGEALALLIILPRREAEGMRKA